MEVEVGCGKWREAQCGSGGGYGWKAVADSAAEAVAVRDGPSLHRPARRSRGGRGPNLVGQPSKWGEGRKEKEVEGGRKKGSKEGEEVGLCRGQEGISQVWGRRGEGRRRRSGKGETREKQLGWLDVGRRRRE